jgi:hypothetical protein
VGGSGGRVGALFTTTISNIVSKKLLLVVHTKFKKITYFYFFEMYIINSKDKNYVQMSTINMFLLVAVCYLLFY